MPTFVLFITLATLLAVVLAVIVLWPWLQMKRSANVNTLTALSVEVFQERIDELHEDYKQGHISQAAFEAQKTELQRQLLQATTDKKVSLDSYDETANNVNNMVDDAVSSRASRVSTESANLNTLNTDNLHQSQPTFTASKDISRNYKVRLTLLIWIPLLIGMGYILAGDRSQVMSLWQSQDKLSTVADDMLTGKIELPPPWAANDGIGLLNTLQTNVYRHAYDAERWMNLSDIFMSVEASEQALEAMARAYRLQPDDEAIALQFAQTQFFISGGQVDATGRQALQRVLAQSPNHQGAQMLMAMVEVRSGNTQKALAWIEQLRMGIAARDGDHADALNSLNALKAQIMQDNVSSAPRQDTSNIEPSNIESIVINVTINPSILPLIENDDIIFISIRAAAGGPPVAVKRLPASELLSRLPKDANKVASADNVEPYPEFQVVLSDNDAMMPTHTLSTAMNSGSELVVNARVSKTGQAISQAGDLAAQTVPLDYHSAQGTVSAPTEENGSMVINLEINEQVR